jgi:hypothetical protein
MVTGLTERARGLKESTVRANIRDITNIVIFLLCKPREGAIAFTTVNISESIFSGWCGWERIVRLISD